MAEGKVDCSVIICAYRGRAVLEPCLRSLMASAGVRFEVIVVENGSPDDSAALVEREFPQVRLIRSGRNLGFAGGNNLGLRAARGAVLVLLNQDTEVPPQWLARLIAPLARDARLGAVGCKLLFPGGRVIQSAGGCLMPNATTAHLGGHEEDRGQWDEPGVRSYVTGAALALRRAALDEVGLLDPGFGPAYFEEVDLQERLARAGWLIWYEPAAWLIHHESTVLGRRSARMIYRYTRNRLRFIALLGCPGGRRAALREERRWLGDVWREGWCWPVARAYFVGLCSWPAWRLDRRRRRTVPRG